MKPLQVSEDILPIGQFKTHASQIVRRLHETRRPFVITQNGKPAAVLLAPDEFDRLQEQARFIQAVEEGLADSSAGRVIADDELDRDLDETFGSLKR